MHDNSSTLKHIKKSGINDRITRGWAAPEIVMSCGNEEAIRLLKATKCSELIKGHPVIEIDASWSISKACSVMPRNDYAGLTL